MLNARENGARSRRPRAIPPAATADAMSFAEPLAQLRRLQELDAERTRLDETVAQLAAAVRDAEAAADAARKAVAREEATLLDLRKRIDRLELDTKTVEAQLEQSQKRRDSATSARQFAALEHEIETEKSKIDGFEEAELELMEQVDAAQARLAGQQTAIAAATEAATTARSEQEAQLPGLTARLAEVAAERDDIAAALPQEAFHHYSRVAGSQRRFAVAPCTADGTCLGCRTRIPPDRLQRLSTARSMVTCPSCKRILYPAEPGDDA
jgi:predicted  nucleic acid-binding Zn-ribbon protein